MIVRNGLGVSFRRPPLTPARHHEAASRDRRPQLLPKRLASVVSWDKAHPNISWPSESEPETRGGRSWEAAGGGSSQYVAHVVGTARTSAFARYGDTYKKGLRYVGGTRSAPIGSPMGGTFTAGGGNTNKIVWLTKTPYRIGTG